MQRPWGRDLQQQHDRKTERQKDNGRNRDLWTLLSSFLLKMKKSKNEIHISRIFINPIYSDVFLKTLNLPHRIKCPIDSWGLVTPVPHSGLWKNIWGINKLRHLQWPWAVTAKPKWMRSVHSSPWEVMRIWATEIARRTGLRTSPKIACDSWLYREEKWKKMAAVVILIIMQLIESGQLEMKLAQAKVRWEAGIIYSWVCWIWIASVTVI